MVTSCFFGPGDDNKTVYAGTLINHEGDWDLGLVLFGRDTGVDAAFATTERGIALFSGIESLLRAGKAGQDGAEQPATAPEANPEGEKKPKPESEGRTQ